jgi:cellulose synthase/poly-beta-1,6-N-acetylglucosamine synthase-like glycosyltransferase
MTRPKQDEQARRRQWGADQHDDPMPALPVPVSDLMVTLGRLAIVGTVAIWLAFAVRTVVTQFVERPPGSAPVLEVVLYLVVVTLLAGSALAYLTTRLGFFYRAGAHRRIARAALDVFLSTSRPGLTVLVPSYQEDARVIRLTLLSAALQEYPSKRVVLLIDDPPQPQYGKAQQLLSDARALPGEVGRLLAEPARRFAGALARFELTADARTEVGPAELRELADHYAFAVQWLGRVAEPGPAADHAERFFASHVIGHLASDLGLTGEALRSAAAEGASIPSEQALHLHQRLAWTFAAELSSFERKRYVSLSHEPNKAMNLNSYIGLMGGSYREVPTPSGLALAPVPVGGDLTVPDCDYILTLDADSVLLPEYCARLVYLLEQPQNAGVAVAQTPYSAYPGAETRLERIAGATTDLQHIVHQGLTYHDATFWVGANAVLRKHALDEMVEVEHMGDWPVRRYIRDRTVIEDTESSIDLCTHGWRLFNYPERLSYSATPPDFGSLCVQRTRWANGGLLISAKLMRQLRARRRHGERTALGEIMLRLNYMASISWASVCLVFLLAYQFNGRLFDPLVFGVALPYFLAMSSDLRYCGYKRIDVLRIYGFNLILLPVNLAGTYHSLVQGLTGAKGQFRRTPKVRNRTTAGVLQVLLPYAIVAGSAYVLVHDYHLHRWVNFAFAAINALLGAYAILAFIGLRNSLVDVWTNVTSWLRAPVRTEARRPPRRAAPVPVQPVSDWQRILHFGSVDPSRQVEGLPLPVLDAPVVPAAGAGRFVRQGAPTSSADLV